jgi:hypothetical protein
MQTMVRIREIGAAFFFFCIVLTAVDLVLVLLHASFAWLLGAGLLLTPPTVYRVIKLMEGAHIGGWHVGHGRRKEKRLPRPIH